MKNRVMRFQLLIAVTLTAFEANGQMMMRDILQVVDSSPLPHLAHKGMLYESAIIIDNTIGVVPNRVYRDFQLAVSSELDDIESPPTFIATFSLSDQENRLSLLRVGCGGEWLCDHLIISDSKGNRLGALEVAVHHSSGVAAKQFRILEDGTVVVSVLKPISGTPVLFESFDSLSAVKMDYIYSITNGEFVLNSTKRSSPALYSREKLSNPEYNLWD